MVEFNFSTGRGAVRSDPIEGERLDSAGRGPQSVAGGGCSVLFGLIFVAAGTAITLVGLKVIPVDPSSVHAPYWVLAMCGLIFALPGLAIIGAGVRAGIQKKQLDALAARNPGQPWLRDFPWDPTEFKGPGWRKVITAFVTGGFFILFLAPFHWWAFTERHPVVVIVVGIFDLVALGIIGNGFYLTMQRQKYGQSALRYHKFPFHPGEMVELSWASTHGLGAYNKITFTLRQIQERKEVRGSGKNRKTVYVRYVQWTEQYTVEGPGQHVAGQDVPISFLLPDGCRCTAMRSDPPCYWELEMHADAPGVDFKETYLVPVYDRA